MNSLTKTNPRAPQTTDEILPAEFEGEIPVSTVRSPRPGKPTGAFLRVHEIEGVAFFFLAAGGIFGHSIHATKWGSEFALFGIVFGFCLGALGREKINRLAKRCWERLKRNS